MAGSIYRRQGTESRKGNISLSLDTQNATAVGGHRLQTEISSYFSGGGRWGGGLEEIKRRTGRQEDSGASIWPSQTWKKRQNKNQTGWDVDNGKKGKGIFKSMF